MSRITNDLTRFGSVLGDNFDKLKKVANFYPFRITEYYNSLIEAYNETDPIFLQSFPSEKEFFENNLTFDPFKEEEKQKVPYFIHRYPKRGVLLVNNFCAMNCRHCMRKRRWDDKQNIISSEELDLVVDYCKKNDIDDVIISGGDPLMLPYEKLEEIIKKIASIPSVRVIRIGSRLTVTDPDRVDEKKIKIFELFDNIFFLTHYNHPKEITSLSVEKIKKIRKKGVAVLNQSVLLKGVNDNELILKKLFTELLYAGIKPYYLHQCDLVKSVTHFWVEPEKAIKMLKAIQGHISGIAIPYYAIDLPGGKGKIMLGPESSLKKENGKYIFYNYLKEKVEYSLF